MKIMCFVALIGLGVPAAAGAQAVFRSGVDVVHFAVSVTDRQGVPITDLTREDFEILEEGRRQTLAYFSRGETPEAAPPLHIGLLFDTSGSMRSDMALAQTAAIKFLNTLHWAEDITLVKFDEQVDVMRYRQADFPRLVERIRSRKADGWTALYDAIGVYLDGAEGQEGQKVLVLLTDGADTRSALRHSEVMDLLRTSDVTVYAIGLLANQPSSVRLQQRLILQRMSELGGGQAFFPMGARELDDMYARIVEELESRYLLGYLPTNTRADGRWRRVEVRLNRPDLRGVKIRTRQGYFAPYRPADGPD
jgi:Ca-activated chloride channel homolog